MKMKEQIVAMIQKLIAYRKLGKQQRLIEELWVILTMMLNLKL